MGNFSRTWWGKRFIEALEEFTDNARLSRGRSYTRGGRIINHEIKGGKIMATVRGKVNPYFGVYKEPKYKTEIEIAHIPKAKWPDLIKSISSRAGFLSRLLMNEIPDNIEDSFSPLKLNLLPHSKKEIRTECSCPDWANPCKHIAGVYYLIASMLDHDPFLLFELRGLSKEKLQEELKKSPLGKILSEELNEKEIEIEKAGSFYTIPVKEEIKKKITATQFWRGEKRLPQTIEHASKAGIPAILIKKQGDYPAFWDKDVSFIETMEQIYAQVREKNKSVM